MGLFIYLSNDRRILYNVCTFVRGKHIYIQNWRVRVYRFETGTFYFLVATHADNKCGQNEVANCYNVLTSDIFLNDTDKCGHTKIKTTGYMVVVEIQY